MDGGGYGEYVVTHSALAFDCPSGLDLVSAASFPEALFTTWLNFFTLMSLEPAERVLIHGGASGVGSIATQVLRALGHAVFVTAGTETKRNVALDLGATAAFDYADEALAERIKSAAGEKGVDAILDMSAGAHIKQDMQILAPNGRISFLSPGKSANLPVPAAAYDDQAHQIDRRNAERIPAQRENRNREKDSRTRSPTYRDQGLPENRLDLLADRGRSGSCANGNQRSYRENRSQGGFSIVLNRLRGHSECLLGGQSRRVNLSDAPALYRFHIIVT
jgi:NADPH:quinone reductase-like Zn-dependent oxidoreductase